MRTFSHAACDSRRTRYPAVVASSWVVLQVPTALLIERFYVNHRCGDPDQEPSARQPLPPAEALRRAQIWLRDKLTIEQVVERCDKMVEEIEDEQEYPPRWLSLAQREYEQMAWEEPSSLPFAHPFYWAAFALHGATDDPTV